MVHLEDEHKEIPDATPIPKVVTKKGQFPTLIEADTIVYRNTLKNTAVKKTF